MTHQYPQVRDALAALVPQALTRLAQMQPDGPRFITLPDQDGWARDSQEIFRQRTRRVWDHPGELIAPWWWRELPAEAALQAALRAHPEVLKRLDNQVGFPFSTRSRDVRTILILQFLSPQVLDKDTYDFHPELFDNCYNRLEAGLLQQQVHMIEIVPLLGLTAALEPLELHDGLSIRPLTDLELSAGIQVLGIPVEAGAGTTNLTVSYLNQHALVRTHTYPIHYGPLAEPVVPLALPSFAEPANRLVTALRLVCGGTVTLGRPIQLQDPQDFDAHPGYSASNTPVDIPDLTSPTVIQDAGQLRAVTAVSAVLALPAVTGDRPLMMALRRLHAAANRAAPEDKLIDLLIAAEALFITRNGLNAHGSKSDKLAAGAVALLSGAPALAATDANIEQHIVSAYRYRNHLMHADTAAPAIRLLSGAATSDLAALTADLHRLMRHALLTTLIAVGSQAVSSQP
jgi:hypothetical protein